MIGTAWLAVLTLLFGETTAGFGLALLAVALWLVFRDLRRRPNAPALGVVAPVDATIVDVIHEPDPVTGAPAQRIDLRQHALGEFNVHAPYEGELEKRFGPHTQGPRKSAGADADPGESGAVWARKRRGLLYSFRTDEGDAVTLGFSTRRIPRMLRLPMVPGDRFGRSKRLGFAGFGLLVHCWVPADSDLIVRRGQRVLGGSDLLGSLPTSGRREREDAPDRQSAEEHAA